MMWEGILAVIAVLGAAVFGSVTTIVLDEVSDVPERIRAALRGPETRSLSARVAKLEMRLVALERKPSRSAA
jgi:hypothetical protein